MSRTKSRIPFVVLLVAALLLSACQPLVMPEAMDAERNSTGRVELGADVGGNEVVYAGGEAEPGRAVTGEIYLPSVPQWGGVTVSMDFDFAEVNPESHEATGYINWHNVIPGLAAGEPHWKGVESEVEYVFFGEDVPGADPHCVAVLTRIVDKVGWGEGAPGQYAYFWFRDGVDAKPDQWGMKYFSFDPFAEFYPEDQAPISEGYLGVAEALEADPQLPLDVEQGSLTFVRVLPEEAVAEPVHADGQRGLYGSLWFPGQPAWGGAVVTMDLDIAEVDPVTHAATGSLAWNNLIMTEEGPAWKRVTATPEYVFFGGDVPGGDPAAVVLIAAIASKSGVGQGDEGEHAYFWFRDGGADAKDQWGMRYFSLDPWQEFYPADQAPVEEGYFTIADMQIDDPILPLEAEIGNIELW